MEEATNAYQAALTADAARYLAERGIGEEEVATYRLGVVADPLPGHGRYRGMLAIPYLAHDAHTLTIRFRCLEEHDHRALGHGKYNTLPGDPPRIYGVDSIHQAGDDIHLGEGELDRIILRKIGWHAVSAPGVEMFFGRHRRMLAGFSRVWVWSDPDDAGARLTAKVTRSLRSAASVRLRTGDVTETYKAGGAQALHDLLEEEKSK
ncbi:MULTISPECIES: topoisomerase [Streptomyces]|uniref:topoisomerase n=1 Tax=Streptomyces TaxID=1883 RepID=UPI0022705A03|nr:MULTISPECIES: topoisomerase [unclassified Streptomyces]MCY0923283.1 topoisomerase [Streptomyces sp. H27-G5]MCY0943974.1 topoisomerase [Streptomyces sp. H34-AA3]MCY0956306.1 topoisomerase [Streptomyces sp. H27-H5]MCZ4082326.1 topoisomerase [Streptomyces sp. H34-S5]